MAGREDQSLLCGRIKFYYAGSAVIVALMGAMNLKAQPSGVTGRLTVTAAVQSSISLVFQNSPSVGSAGFCPLVSAGTNAVGLDLGTASIRGDTRACVAYSRGVRRRTYEVYSAFDVIVNKANTASSGYQLAAQISAAPPQNVVWLVNGTALNNAGFTLLDASDNYGTPVTKTLQVQVSFWARPQALPETITFLATAN